jgi:hypothetical protein
MAQGIIALSHFHGGTMITLRGREVALKTQVVNRILRSKEKLEFVTQDMGDKLKISLKLGALQQSFIYINKKNSSENQQLNAQRDLLCRFCVERRIDIAI